MFWRILTELTARLVLYIIYFPPHRKYLIVDVETETGPHATEHVKTNVKTDAWRTSVTLAWVVLGHM
jgi:hypothetical protein